MKKIIRFILFFPLLALIVSLFFAYCEGKGRNSDFNTFSCLVAGYDEAAENTDVLFVISYERSKNEISFIQIPRDSFSEYRGSYGKINRIYSLERASGKSEDEALKCLASSVEEYLGIELDAAAALSFGAFSRLVDMIGGVYINVPDSVDLVSLPIKLSYGENLLSGKEALELVRGRSSYPNGDLGRLDTQKLFLEGLFHTAFERLDAKTLAKLVLTRDEEVFVSASLFELSSFILCEFNDIKHAKVALLTLPGAACEYGGASYYVINRMAASDVVSKYLGGNFDKEYKLTDVKNSLINGMYEKRITSYKVFSDGKTIDINVS